MFWVCFVCVFGWSTALWVVSFFFDFPKRKSASLNPSRGMKRCWAVCKTLGSTLSVRFSLEGRPKNEGEGIFRPHYPVRSPTLLQARTATFPATFAAAHLLDELILTRTRLTLVDCLPAPITGAVCCVFLCVFVRRYTRRLQSPPGSAPEAIALPCSPSFPERKGRGFRKSRLGVCFSCVCTQEKLFCVVRIQILAERMRRVARKPRLFVVCKGLFLFCSVGVTLFV